MAFQPAKCPDNCVYLMTINGNEPMCGYLFITHTMRGCDPGPGCKRYVGKLRNNRGYKRKTPKWDVEKGRELWEQGYSDTQIAQVVVAKRDTVSVYRRKHWGERNSKKE